jgi:hypothetical protein
VLSTDSVSAVQLKRAAIPTSSFPWQLSDTKASMTLGEASGATAACLVASTYDAPETVLDDMTMLIRLCARIATHFGADGRTLVNSRLLVTSDLEGPGCPRLHYDKVALRLSCTYVGEGTRWLPQTALNSAALLRLIRPSTEDAFLKQRLLTDTRLYNAAVRWPWYAESRTGTGDVLFMKGSAWRRLPRARGVKRALPVMHRSPPDDGQPHSRRVLFTVDFGGGD